MPDPSKPADPKAAPKPLTRRSSPADFKAAGYKEGDYVTLQTGERVRICKNGALANGWYEKANQPNPIPSENIGSQE